MLPNPRRSEIDFESQDILNKLYGNKWQTPELLQKCASRSRGDVSRNISRPLPFTEVKRPKLQKPQTRDSFANDFCILRRNAPDLESTRIGTYETQKPTETETIIEEESIVESTEEFKKPNDNNLLTSKLSSKSNVSDNSSLTLRSRKKKRKYNIAYITKNRRKQFVISNFQHLLKKSTIAMTLIQILITILMTVGRMM